MKPKFSITYQIVTPESATHGDYAEEGFIVEEGGLRECLDALFSTRTSAVGGIVVIEAGEGRITVDNGAEFETGAYESRALHMRHVSIHSQKRIAVLVGANWN